MLLIRPAAGRPHRHPPPSPHPCNADLTKQDYGDQPMMGLSVLHISPKPGAHGYELPQINDVSFFLNAGTGYFDRIATVGLDRNARIGMDDPANPVGAMFD
jgi:hypothetical protein